MLCNHKKCLVIDMCVRVVHNNMLKNKSEYFIDLNPEIHDHMFYYKAGEI